VLIGLAWIALLDPAWPGFLLVVVAAAMLIRGWLAMNDTAVEQPAAINIAEATTIYRPQR